MRASICVLFLILGQKHSALSVIFVVRVQGFLDIDFLTCSLGNVSLAAGALGTEWQKEAGGLNSQYVGYPTSLVHYFLLPYSAYSSLLDLVPLWEGQFLHRVNLLSSCCWPGRMLVPWLPKIGCGDPSVALPPVKVAPVLITYLFQESGACYLLRLCRALLGESDFYRTLRFLFPPLCKVLWCLQSVSPKWADFLPSDAASPILCAFVKLFISLYR